MKLREVGAKIILGSMVAPFLVGFIGWAGLEIVSAANSIGVLEVRIDSVEQKEQRIYDELKTINQKIDKILERE